VAGKNAPKNEKERLDVLRTMHAHAQFCMSGDHTLSATVVAINDLAQMADEHDESVASPIRSDTRARSNLSFSQMLRHCAFGCQL
jgi:hypothetical protein